MEEVKVSAESSSVTVSSEQRTTRTATKHTERSERVKLSDDLVVEEEVITTIESGASHQRGRGGVRYEVDTGKVIPKIIMIKRTEANRHEALENASGQGGHFQETTINVNFKSKENNSSATSPAEMRVGFDRVVTNWTKEKTNLQDLNNRLSDYIDKVRFLEQQNKKLVDQLEGLRKNWVNATMKVKEEFTSQLTRHRHSLNQAELTKAHIEVQLASLEDRYHELQIVYDEVQHRNTVDLEEITRLKELLVEYESELNLLRRRVASFDSEDDKDQKEIEKLRRSVISLRTNLDNETENHLQAELQAQSLREELEFMNSIHEAELKELEGLIYKESSSESKGFWRNELAQALEEIQADYDSRVEEVKTELEIQYEKKVTEAAAVASNQEVHVAKSEEVAKSRSESEAMKRQAKELEMYLASLQDQQRQLAGNLAELQRQFEESKRNHDKDRLVLIRQLTETQSELDHIMKELRTLLDTKLSLDLQIAAYRKLIEGEEARVQRDSYSSAAHSVVTQLITTKKEFHTGGGYIVSGSTSSAGGALSASSGISISGSVSTTGGALSASGEEDSSITASVTSGEQSSSVSRTGTVTTVEETKVQESTSTELTAKTSFNRSAKGPVGFKECATDGRFVKLEHLGKRNPKREDISGWKISRVVDGKDAIEFVLPEGTFLDPEGERKELIIWALTKKPEDASDKDLEFTEESWGFGNNVVTKLIDAKGDDRAVFKQETVYTAVA